MSFKLIDERGAPIVLIEDDGTVLDPDGTEHIFKEEDNDQPSGDDNIPETGTEIRTNQQGSHVPKRDKKAVDSAS